MIAKLVAEYPHLATDAARWGWDDTVAREQLAEALSVTLLSRPWPSFGDAAREAYCEDLRRAYDAWAAEHSAS